MPDSPVLLIFEESRRLLVRQEADFDTLRGRATAVFSASAIANGLFAGQYASAQASGTAFRPLPGLAAAAVVVFVLGVGATAFILWPRKLVFSYDQAQWLNMVSTKPAGVDLDTLAFNLATDFDLWRHSNLGPIRRAQWAQRVLCALVGVQVALWAWLIL